MDQADIDRITWFHAIEVEKGALITPGRFRRDVPPNWTLFPVFGFIENIDLTDLECLDIGTTDGLIAFIMRLRGGRVVAADRAKREAFGLVRDHLGLDDVIHLPHTTIDGGELENRLRDRSLPEKFDLVVLAGVVYHVYDPLLLLMWTRRLINNGGFLIVETPYHRGDDPVLYVNWEAPKPETEPNTYFQPTISGLEAMLRFCCCDPIATVINGNRLGILARAVAPHQVTGATAVLENIFAQSICYGPLDFSELNRQSGSTSGVRYTGPTGQWSIDAYRYKTSLPLQPQWDHDPFLKRLRSRLGRFLGAGAKAT